MIPADVVSLNGIESISSFASSRDGNHRVSTDQVQKTKELLSREYSGNISEAARISDVQHSSVDVIDSQCKCDRNIVEGNEPVFLDEISSVDANSIKEDGILDNCGILPNNCLPCLASTVPSIEKRRSSSSSPPSARKKTPMKISSKLREGHGIATLCKLKFLQQHSFDTMVLFIFN